MAASAARLSLAALATLELNRGDLLITLSLLLWSIYTICLHWRPAGMHLLSFLFVIAVVGDCAMLPLYVAETLAGSPMSFTPESIVALLFVALFSSVLGYIFWNRGVEQVGANIAGLFVHLMPVFGTVLAWIFLGEVLHPFHIVGVLLILTGIAVTSRAAARASAEPQE
jgi:drug/metabolite transporter (DMT)-like permease